MGDSAENENGNEYDEEVNRQADKTPEVVAAGFKEPAGVHPLSGIVSSQNSARGEDREDCEKGCSQQGSRYRSAKWKFGIQRERAGGSKVESVHKLVGGQTVVQNRGDAFIGSTRREVSQHEIHDVNQPENALAVPDERGAGEKRPRGCVCHCESLHFRMLFMRAMRAAEPSTR